VEGISFAHREELCEKCIRALIACVDGISLRIKPLLCLPAMRTGIGED
jgi:hypothetical protein